MNLLLEVYLITCISSNVGCWSRLLDEHLSLETEEGQTWNIVVPYFYPTFCEWEVCPMILRDGMTGETLERDSRLNGRFDPTTAQHLCFFPDSNALTSVRDGEVEAFDVSESLLLMIK